MTRYFDAKGRNKEYVARYYEGIKVCRATHLLLNPFLLYASWLDTKYTDCPSIENCTFVEAQIIIFCCL